MTVKKIKIKIFKLGFPLFLALRKVFRFRSFGAKAVIVQGQSILLVRHNYGPGNWTLPGGGVGKKETAEQALVRELKEELGLEVLGRVRFLDKINVSGYDRTIVFVFTVDIDKSERDSIDFDSVEIKEIKWFDLNELPELKPIARQMVECYLLK